MSRSTYHILNGDALADRFPSEITGEIIVIRECLIEGPFRAKSLDELIDLRSDFLKNEYHIPKADYIKKSATEFKRIQEIPLSSEINLWFEDDLFCQINLWYTLSLLQPHFGKSKIYLVRPTEESPYGFGHYDQCAIVSLFKNRLPIRHAELFEDLWNFYQHDEYSEIVRLAKKYSLDYPFLLPAIEAHIDRIPTNESQGRPMETLKSIIKEYDTNDFSTIFTAFSQREGIYGFGDLQVKRMLDLLLQNSTMTYHESINFMKQLIHFFKRKHPTLRFGKVYQGSPDFSYFSISNDPLKAKKLKYVLVYAHEQNLYKICLSAQNKELRKEYWKKFNTHNHAPYELVAEIDKCLHIMEYCVNTPLHHPQTVLFQYLENEIIQFITKVDSYIDSLR